MPPFYTTKGEVPLAPGQTLGFERGRGYYAKGRARSLDEIAREQADAALAPFFEQLSRLKEEAGERARMRGEAVQGFSTALAGLQEGYKPAVESAYQTAVANTGALAKGYSDGFRAAVGGDAQAGNELLALHGSPQRIEDRAGAADVLYGLTGAIPGGALAREGAAFAAAAGGLPETTRSRGLQDFTRLQYEAEDEQRGLDERILEGEARRPELVRQLLDEMLDRQQQQEALEIQREYLLNTLRQTGASITGVDPVTGLPTAGAAAAAAGAQGERAKQRQQAIAKRNEATVEAIMGATDWVEAQLKPGSQQVETGRVPIQLGAKSIKGVGSVPLYAAQGGGTTTDPKQALTRPVYEQVQIPKPKWLALRRKLTSRLTAQLRRFAYKPADIRRIADDILDDYFTFSERVQRGDYGYPGSAVGGQAGSAPATPAGRRGGR